jgi:KDO2-lipid IV(A) lauroyltransferase
LLGLLPRHLARSLCGNLATFAICVLRKKKPLQTAHKTIAIAFPEWNEDQRWVVLKTSVRHLLLNIAEIAHFPIHNRDSIEEIVLLEGLEHYQAAVAQGKGVLILSGHFSAFELFPMTLGLLKLPIHFLVRPINNPMINQLISHYRSIFGSVPIGKNQAAKQVLNILRYQGTVCMTIDQNTTLNEGIFVDFFSKPACTTTGLARLALKTEAAVVPGFIIWDEHMKKYRLSFDPAIEMIRTGDRSFDVRQNTLQFTQLIEKYVRAYPEQWTRWVHNRWKTRPIEEMKMSL